MTNDLSRQVAGVIEKHALIMPGDHVLVGVSGGPDSLCLLEVLRKLAPDAGFSLSALHVNHKFRPGAAEEDAAFVKSFCEARGIPIRIVERDCPALAKEMHLSPEEAGRKARYEAFSAAVSEIGAPAKIAVAHNKNDRAETVLLHLFRGSGLDGLSGMEFLRKDKDGYCVIRPLLATSREDIEAYCEEEGLSPCIDATNQEVRYRRNRVRNEVLPYIEEHFNSGIIDSLVRTSELLTEDRDYLRREAEVLKRKVAAGEHLSREILREADGVLRRRIIRNCLFEVGISEDVSRRQVEDADRLLIGDASSGSIDFPKGYRFFVSYDIAGIRVPGKEQVFALPKLLVTEGLPKEFAGKKKEGYGFALFDADKLAAAFGDVAQKLQVRCRMPGDFLGIRTKNGFGKKRLQDLFVDCKVPKEARDNVAFVALGSEILWIPKLNEGARYSAKYGVTEDTERVLCLEIQG